MGLLAGIPPGGLGLSGLDHEKAHPSTSKPKLLLNELMASRIDCPWSDWFLFFY